MRVRIPSTTFIFLYKTNIMYKCEICGKEFKNSSAYGGHKASHNPELYIKSSNSLTLQRVKIIKKCLKCGKEFEIERKIKKDGTQHIDKKERKYCSHSCGNSRKHTEKTKLKISIKIKGKIPHNKGKTKYKRLYCKCGKQINKKSKSGLCFQCKIKSQEHRDKQSNILKKQYKNGKKVYGGTTKWFYYKNIKVQGTYELRTCFVLDKMLENKEILCWEYTKDRIVYIDEDNKEHMYLFDFKVNNSYYIETKGYTTKKDLLKWKAAEEQNKVLIKWFNEDIIREEIRLGLK